MSNLPDGFVLDQPPNQQAAPALPDGFVIDHPSMWQDAVKSADAGIGKGLTTLLGLPGNVATFAHAVAPQGVTDAIKSVPGANWLYNHIPGSEALKATIPTDFSANYNKDAEYEPQYATGRYTKAIAAQVPMMATGMGVVPAITSGVGGQVASDLTGGNRWAEAAGSIVGGGLPAVLKAQRLMRAASAAAPSATINDVKASATADYNSPALKDLRITPQSVQNLGNKIATDLTQNGGYDTTNNAPVFNTAARLTKRQGPAPVSFDELSNIRKGFKNIAQERQGDGSLTPNATAATKAIGHIDDFIQNDMTNPANVIQGDPMAAAHALRTADANWGAAKRAFQVKGLLDDAARAAARRDSGDNLGNATRQQMDTLLQKNARRAQGFNPAEKQAVTDVVEGNGGINLARSAANFARNPFLIAGQGAHAAISPATGIPLVAAQYALATGAKRLVGYMTAQKGRAVQDMLLSRAPAYQVALTLRRAFMQQAQQKALANWHPLGQAVSLSQYGNNNGGN
jgi:hypothetical protein